MFLMHLTYVLGKDRVVEYIHIEVLIIIDIIRSNYIKLYEIMCIYAAKKF
jgi:hypothetical protein